LKVIKAIIIMIQLICKDAWKSNNMLRASFSAALRLLSPFSWLVAA